MAFMKVEFPGGLKVNGNTGKHTIETDQTGEAPSPLELFLASLATCGGVYALSFCKNKGLSTEGLEIDMNLDVNQASGLVSHITFDVKLPEDFPEKYKNALVRSINLCSVKRHLEDPPTFTVNTHY